MGQRGPAPKPTKLKLLEGNPGKRPMAKNEPKPAPVRPTQPGWLITEAKREWARVVPELERLGLLTKIDRAALAIYCQAWGRYVEAQEMLSQYGSVLKAKESDYIQISPYAIIARQNSQTARAFCQEFGLTPSARGRMQLPDDDDEDDDLLD